MFGRKKRRINELEFKVWQLEKDLAHLALVLENAQNALGALRVENSRLRARTPARGSDGKFKKRY